MSHGDAIVRAPDGFTVTATTDDAPVAALENRERAIYGVQFHPEVVHTPYGQRVLEHFLYDGAGLAPSWTMRSVIESSIESIRAQVGTGRAICGLVRWRRFGSRRGARASGHRSAVDVCLRRHRADAQRRSRAGRRDIPPPSTHRADPCARRRAVLRAPRRRHRSRAEAQDHRRALHPRLRRSGARHHRRQVLGARHALSRRHRVGHQRCGQDQVAPQRRRPARRHAIRARRAAAQPVQGRGPPGRRRAGPARRDRVAPALPRAGARRAHHRRGHARTRRRSCSTPTRSSAKRSRPPGSSARSGRPSPCCPTSARSVSWATSAPTRTRSSSAR